MQNTLNSKLVQKYVLGKIMAYDVFLNKKRKAKIIITIDDKDISKYSNMQFAATAYSAMLCMREGIYSSYDTVSVLLFERQADSGVCLARAVYEDGNVNVYTFDNTEFGPSQDCIGIAEIIDLIKIGEHTATTDADYITVGEYTKITPEKAKELHLSLDMFEASINVTDKMAGIQSTPPNRRLLV